jgi:hypothetical protein
VCIRARVTLAAAPVLFAHAAITFAKNKQFHYAQTSCFTAPDAVADVRLLLQNMRGKYEPVELDEYHAAPCERCPKDLSFAPRPLKVDCPNCGARACRLMDLSQDELEVPNLTVVRRACGCTFQSMVMILCPASLLALGACPPPPPSVCPCLGVEDVRRQSVCAHSMDWRCHKRGTQAT